jgi:hypothetical protein
MKKIIFLLSAIAVGVVFWNCSSADDEASSFNGRWTLSTIATKDSGDVETETRALFIGGASGKRYVSLWDENDVIQVYRAGTASWVGTMEPAKTDVPTTELVGTFTGDVSAGETLDMYIPSADIDYTGQNGLLESMTNYAHMTAQVQINRIEGGNVYTNDVTFTGKESYNRFRFTDKEDGMRLPVEKLTIQAASGKLLLRKPLTPTAEDPIVYGDLVITTEKKNGAYPNEVYVAMHNDLGAKDNYTFTIVSGGYVYASSPVNNNFKDTKYTLASVKVSLVGSADKIQNGSSVKNFTDGEKTNGIVGF